MATRGSEFGGVPGRIAPLPHELSAYEQHRLLIGINPTDAVSTVDDARLEEALMEGRKGIVNPDGWDGQVGSGATEPPFPSAVRPNP